MPSSSEHHTSEQTSDSKAPAPAPADSAPAAAQQAEPADAPADAAPEETFEPEDEYAMTPEIPAPQLGGRRDNVVTFLRNKAQSRRGAGRSSQAEPQAVLPIELIMQRVSELADSVRSSGLNPSPRPLSFLERRSDEAKATPSC